MILHTFSWAFIVRLWLLLNSFSRPRNGCCPGVHMPEAHVNIVFCKTLVFYSINCTLRKLFVVGKKTLISLQASKNHDWTSTFVHTRALHKACPVVKFQMQLDKGICSKAFEVKNNDWYICIEHALNGSEKLHFINNNIKLWKT